MRQKAHESNQSRSNSGLIENYNIHINTHDINEETDSFHSMIKWIKNARVIWKKLKKSDISNMLLMHWEFNVSVCAREMVATHKIFLASVES